MLFIRKYKKENYLADDKGTIIIKKLRCDQIKDINTYIRNLSPSPNIRKPQSLHISEIVEVVSKLSKADKKELLKRIVD